MFVKLSTTVSVLHNILLQNMKQLKDQELQNVLNETYQNQRNKTLHVGQIVKKSKKPVSGNLAATDLVSNAFSHN